MVGQSWLSIRSGFTSPPLPRSRPRARCWHPPPGDRRWDFLPAKTPRQRLVHHNHRRRLAGVRVREPAPRQQRNPMVRKYAEVTDRSSPIGRCSGAGAGRPSTAKADPHPARQRQPTHGAHRANSRQRRHPVRHLLEERDPPVRRRVPASRQRHPQGKQPEGRKPGSADRNLTKLRINSPAPISTTTASAISATTSALRTMRPDRPTVPPGRFLSTSR